MSDALDNSLYIKGPVLSPGISDSVSDRPLTPEEIQKAAYQFLPGSPIVDVQHAFKKIADVVESYVTPEPTKFNNMTYPAGTWFVTSRVTDPTIKKAIQDGELTGYSVGALPEKQYSELKRSLPAITKAQFNSVKEGEWFPLTVSIVDRPSYKDMIFKVFGADEVIKKSREGYDRMSEENAIVGMFGKLLDHVITKSDDKKKEGEDDSLEKRVEKLETDFKGKLDDINEKLDKLNNGKKSEKKEEEKEKDDKKSDDKKKDEEKEKTKTDEENKDKTEEKTEQTIEQTSETTPTEEATNNAITKSIPIDSEKSAGKKSFMEKLGADPFGRNKKYL